MNLKEALAEARYLIDQYVLEGRRGNAPEKITKEQRNAEGVKGDKAAFREAQHRGEIRSTRTQKIVSKKDKGDRGSKKRAALADQG